MVVLATTVALDVPVRMQHVRFLKHTAGPGLGVGETAASIRGEAPIPVAERTALGMRGLP